MPEFWRSAEDPERVMHASVTHWQETAYQQREDLLTVEEPFEVRIGGRSLAVIMRTPGNDHALAMGFLYTEGVITSCRRCAIHHRCGRRRWSATGKRGGYHVAQ